SRGAWWRDYSSAAPSSQPTLDANSRAEEYGTTSRETRTRTAAADLDAAVHRHEEDPEGGMTDRTEHSIHSQSGPTPRAFPRAGASTPPRLPRPPARRTPAPRPPPPRRPRRRGGAPGGGALPPPPPVGRPAAQPPKRGGTLV